VVVQFNAGTNAASAASLAKSVDVAVVFADQYMSEGGDAPSLSLPDNQNELISAVAAANPHTVVVLITGNPVTMPWIDRVAGVMEAWYPGYREPPLRECRSFRKAAYYVREVSGRSASSMHLWHQLRASHRRFAAALGA
jgi:hypothetical protein